MSSPQEMDAIVSQLQNMKWDEFYSVLELVSSEEEKSSILSLVAKNRMGDANAKYISFKLGKLLALDAYEYLAASKRSFLRLRVDFDLTKPLVSGFPIPCLGLSTTWVQFKYKKLADFCYVCGRIGHTQSSCRLAAVHTGKLPFDYKMCADSSSLRRDPVVRVMQSPRCDPKSGLSSSPDSSCSKGSSVGWRSPGLPFRVGKQVVVGANLEVRVFCLADMSAGTSPILSSLVIEDSLKSQKSSDLSHPVGETSQGTDL
ncbi:hypothetical protein CJ030_MR3G005775 [Morella rubra]|uniref:CCHC-type domain-containing protein n=1 Tax=Morella rubra TaxID=262757 RepID=A0A6A1W622_9ROSI|nr:hypothetical protein CJ030_MR3G005775 [Morella rubra]